MTTSALTSGKTTSCGCYHASLSAEISKKSRHKVRKRIAGFNTVLSNYRKAAEKKGRVFELEEGDVKILFNSPCHYCGTMYSNTYNRSYYDYKYNGIDRVDNNEGYTLANCVPCCKICNHAKHTMTQQEFIQWIEKVYAHMEELRK